MSYKKIETWTIKTKGESKRIKYCPKCNMKSEFVNSKKFRVNANGKNLDIWLIYNCVKCKSKWNMPIYERISPTVIESTLLNRFMTNDPVLAIECENQLSENRLSNQDILVETSESAHYSMHKDVLEVNVINPYRLEIRTEKLIAQQLGIPRSLVVQQLGDQLNRNKKIKSEMTLLIPETLYKTSYS